MSTRINWLAALAVGMPLVLSGCGGDDDNAPNLADEDTSNCPVDFADDGPGPGICVLSGTLTADVTLTPDIQWVLSGKVQVGEDVGGDAANPDASATSAILTIEPGTTISGQSGADFLVISRGSEINAVGTEADPIVMTAADESGRGKWGGLIINGRATLNGCTVSGICEAEGEGSTGFYGGNDDTDSSGTLQYVIVRHAGFEITPENELNGIAFQGVGNGTTVDHIQVHLNSDDGVEFFGGTVNVKNIVLTGIRDDSIDWTQGWRGNIQYAVVKQYADDADQGIEADNNGDANDSTPRALPTLSNLTLLGNGADASTESDIGMLLREGTGVNLHNVIVANFGDVCIDIDQEATFTNAGATAADAQAGDQLTIDNSIVNNCGLEGSAGTTFKDNEVEDTNGDDVKDPATGDFQDPWLVSDWYAAGSNNSEEDPDLNGYIPNAASPALAKGAAPAAASGGTAASFFDAVDFVGGVKDTAGDWTGFAIPGSIDADNP